jgi:toxin ParE1/3/4
VARKVVLLDSASTDLTELGLYIASQGGVQVANGYLDRIYATCMGLATFPERGRRRDAYGGRDFESELRKGK